MRWSKRRTYFYSVNLFRDDVRVGSSQGTFTVWDVDKFNVPEIARSLVKDGVEHGWACDSVQILCLMEVV